MSTTTLKSPNGLKDSECKKRELSNRPPVPYVPVMDLVTTKEEPQVLKPDDTCLNMPIFSCGNTEEYLAHIVAVPRIFKQKGLNVRSRKLGKAAVKLSKFFKNLLEAVGLKETISSYDDVKAHKLEIKETQKMMLQETQKQHNEAITKTYKQLRKLLSGDPQSQ